MKRVRTSFVCALIIMFIVQMTPIALTPASAASVLLADDFESYSESPVGDTWFNSTNNGSWVLESDDSKMLKLDSAGTTYVVSRGEDSWEDYTVSAKVKITSTPTEGTVRAGIAARHTDKRNYYSLMIRRSTSKDYMLLVKRVDNSQTTLAEETLTSTIDESKVYDLKFEIAGNVLKGYVDDELLVSVTDDALTHGSIGLYSNSHDEYAGAVLFDDVLVTENEPSTDEPSDPGEDPDDGSTEDPSDEIGGIVHVSDSDELNDAIDEALPGTTIILADGSYEISKIDNKHGTEEHPILIKAANPGGAVITDRTVYIQYSSYITLEGLEFRNEGYYGVRMTNNHHIRLTNNHFERPADSGSSTWVQIDGANSHHNRIDHNVFQNKQEPGKFIVIGGDNPGFTGISQYDLIDHNVFRNTLPRQTNESEPIRVGESKLSKYDSYTTIEHNTFEHTDSDPEIISLKSGKNIVRYNTFYESLGTLTLRHGDGSVVYGNQFIGNGRTGTDQDGNTIGTGGIRIYGDDHLIFNNYFAGLTGTKWDAPITITNGDADYSSSSDLSKHFRPRNIQIVHNTFVDNNSTIELGFTNNGKYSYEPQNITFANNIAVSSDQPIVQIHSNETEILSEVTWEGNMMYPQNGAELGISVSEDQIKVIDPKLADNGAGIMIPSADSPALHAGSR